MDKQRFEKDGRRIHSKFPLVFLVDYWVDNGLDDMLIEWQVQPGNMDKSVPLLLYFLLDSLRRDTLRELYLERYHTRRILPEWDCVPVYKELEMFIRDEASFFDERMSRSFVDMSFVDLFDADWRNVVVNDFCYCDFEMCPVTQLLTTIEY